jgi:hypothetical protein
MEWKEMKQLIKYHPLLDPNGGGGGGTASWRDSLPEDLRNDPLLAPVRDVNELAKMHVHAQRMLGDRLPKPKPDWKPEQWSEFYNNLGRPADPEKYKLPEFQFPEGFPELNKEKMGAALKHLHSVGLTQQQVEGVMKLHFEELAGAHKAQSEARKNAHAQVMLKLNEKLGDPDKVGHALERTRNAIKKLGGETGDFDSLLDFVTEKGLDNNFEFLMMIGEMMEEDSARGGGHGGGFAPTAAAAASEIERLSYDKDFQAALDNRNAPGHKEAVARWTHLFGVAHPGKVKED